MEGIVLGYEAEQGVIKGSDDHRYRFARAEWKARREPAAGVRVDFVAEEGEAREIYPVIRPLPPLFAAAGSLENPEKGMPMAVYLCYAAAFVYGLSMIIGVVIAYVSRSGAEGTWYKSHFDYQIAIFWKSLAGFLISIPLLFVFGIGALVMLGTYIWVLAKVLKGWRWLSEGVEVPR